MSGEKGRTMAICVGAVPCGIQDHADEFEDGDNQGAKRDRAEREGRRADERRERGVLRLASK